MFPVEKFQGLLLLLLLRGAWNDLGYVATLVLLDRSAQPSRRKALSCG